MFSYFSRPTLHVELEQSTVFVHAPNRPDAPADDPLIHGQVTMDVLKPTAVESVHVSLRGVTDVCAGTGQPYETTTNLEKSLDIDVKGELLEPGKHTYALAHFCPPLHCLKSADKRGWQQLQVLLHHPFLDGAIPALRLWSQPNDR